MDDMINMLMFTIEPTSSHMMIGLGVVDLDRVSLNNPRDVEFSGSSICNLDKLEQNYHEHSLKHLFANML